MTMPTKEHWQEFLQDEQEDMRRASNRMLTSAIGAIIALVVCVVATLAIIHS